MTTATTANETLKRIDSDHVWHPFTPMRAWRAMDMPVIERAEGFRLIDTDGNAYIDGNSSLWCNVHGHRVPEIDAAIRDQLEKIAHSTMLGLSNVPATEFARRLVEVAPGAMKGEKTKVFYSDAGATAVEVGMKIARGHHYYRGEPGRDTFVGVRGAYHGDTSGSMSIGYDDHLHAPFRPMTFGCEWARSPAPCVHEARGASSSWPSGDEPLRERSLHEAVGELASVLERLGERCAGVVVEPLIQGASGIYEHPEGYLRAISDLARDHGVPLIADEVAVGFGRAGAMFACDAEGVTPDILCLGKGITGGYMPLAATLVREEIAASFDGAEGEYRTFFHGHTYTGNPLACAAGLASLDLLIENSVVENANAIGGAMRTMLREALADHPNVGDVRGRGVITGIELLRTRSPHRAFDRTARVSYRVCDIAREAGAIVRPLGDVLVLNPAPAMDEGTARRLTATVIDAIKTFDFDRV